MTTIKAGGRTYTLYFTLAAMDEIEDALGEPLTFEENQLTEIMTDRRKAMKVFTAFANQGEIAQGREGDLTVKSISRTIRPGEIMKLENAIVAEIVAGARMETETDDDAEVDVVLEELKKKETKAE